MIYEAIVSVPPRAIGRRVVRFLGGGCLAYCLSCQSARKGDAEFRTAVERQMKDLIAAQLDEWSHASRELAALAPAPEDRGWRRPEDAAALANMKEAWIRGRDAYELIEGAIAPIFPESDAATDSRYDDFLVRIGPQGDPKPFDGEGVIGMHAIERVLWADSIGEEVLHFESGLPGYRPARFPGTASEARAFKEELVGRLIRDIDALRATFDPLSLDIAFAYQGLIDLAAEQAEKVDRAATGQEESRYARTTMRDLRANYHGCLNAYLLFQPWVRSKQGGAELDAKVTAAFERLENTYAVVSGDSIPGPPPGWSSISPRAEHATTPFGRLFHAVGRESDPAETGSLTFLLYAVAELLGLEGVVKR